MRRALVTLSSITLVIAVISGAGTANAGVGKEQAGTAVSISNNYEAVTTTSICGYDFNYVQRMTVDGGASAWVPIEFVSRPGRFGMTLAATCEGYSVYMLDTSCSCQFVAVES